MLALPEITVIAAFLEENLGVATLKMYSLDMSPEKRHNYLNPFKFNEIRCYAYRH